MTALRALTTWVEHGVLKEEGDERFRLLNVAEDAASSSRVVPSRSGKIHVGEIHISHSFSLNPISRFNGRGPDGYQSSTTTGRADESLLEGS